eukprot:gnl/MRDRNA2_/MRDRNA2_61960_c0_seq2.p1 gnl/MRDRNA2_/MRDRNA2_61960_c0~~gnl/MRDRNA2_/MRDRNA2_61960_c0_seq2.p1  ORF type:complete len:565 (+),score=127.88 gnl/MRDRNA2_/MRDRNA2_61960_c0_seq2:249-1697(+)
MAKETDLNAAQEQMPFWLLSVNRGFVVFYTLELVARLYVDRIHFFETSWNNLDLLIVTFGIVGEIVEGALDSISVIRTLRLLRMMRVVRVLNAFKELWALIRDMVDCMRTLFWAFVLMAITLTVWSIFCVELLNHLVVELAEEGVYGTCSWCGTAFSSVLEADLTLFQIVSGDGWSLLARPLIERHPRTAFIFLGIIFTFSFGFLNIIVAVMIENAAEGRRSDYERMAKTKEEAKQQGKARFLNLCRKIDTDDSGSISLEEVEVAAIEVPEFRDVLRVMDIETNDIHCVFALLDEDRSGQVEYEEFAEQLWKMKSQEQHTTLMILKYYILQLWEKVKSETSRLQDAYIRETETHSEKTNVFFGEVKERVDTTQEVLREVLGRIAPSVVGESDKGKSGRRPASDAHVNAETTKVDASENGEDLEVHDANNIDTANKGKETETYCKYTKLGGQKDDGASVMQTDSGDFEQRSSAAGGGKNKLGL